MPEVQQCCPDRYGGESRFFIPQFVVDEDIFFFDYNGCSYLASTCLDMPTRLRRKFIKRLRDQLEFEREQIEKASKHKGK